MALEKPDNEGNMIIRKISFFCAIGIIAILALSAAAQDELFSDVNVDYSFALPDAKWKMTAKPSATSPKDGWK